MPGLFWQSMTGIEGKVTVPSVGAVIGTIKNWSLKRPEESSPANPGLLTLRAYFSYVNEGLMNDPDITKSIDITIRKEKHYRICFERMAFDGTVLVAEGCSLCRPEE